MNEYFSKQQYVTHPHNPELQTGNNNNNSNNNNNNNNNVSKL